MLDNDYSDMELEGGGEAKLPFAAPTIWWMNGDASSKALGGVSYYGGWRMSADELPEGLVIPNGFTKIETASRGGKEYAALEGRAVLVAPFVRRKAWRDSETGARSAHYEPGLRQHMQVLAYMATKQEKTITPWGPVVLSVKGFQVKFLEEVMAEWGSLLAPVRREHAPNIPPTMFYMLVGTFGEKRNSTLVGKKATSPVVPVSLWKHENMNGELLEKLFVGAPVAEKMKWLKEQAKAWASAWDEDAAPAANDSYAPVEDGLF